MVHYLSIHIHKQDTTFHRFVQETAAWAAASSANNSRMASSWTESLLEAHARFREEYLMLEGNKNNVDRHLPNDQYHSFC